MFVKGKALFFLNLSSRALMYNFIDIGLKFE